MAKTARFANADWNGITAIALIGVGMALFREVAIVPVSTVALCAGAKAPVALCAPRAAVLWLQYEHLFGTAALILGIIGFCCGKRWAGVLGIAIGIAAVVNYNATDGIIGASLGLFAWMGIITGRYAPSA